MQLFKNERRGGIYELMWNDFQKVLVSEKAMCKSIHSILPFEYNKRESQPRKEKPEAKEIGLLQGVGGNGMEE